VRFVYKGNLIWEKIAMKAVRDHAGRTIRVQGHSIDVTEKVQAAERLRQERVRLKTLEGSVFESFSFNLTKVSRPDVQTKDEAMLQAEISPEILSEALHICPALADTNPETRAILLKAASRIPDAEDRKLFISTCSSSAMRSAVREGHYGTEIRYRRFVKDMVRWVLTRAEILPDPDNGDLIAFYYTKDINNEVIKELVSENIIEKNYACVSCLDLQSGLFTVLSGTDNELLGLSGKQYSEALKEATIRFVAKYVE
jgi:PAS domain-containing protein